MNIRSRKQAVSKSGLMPRPVFDAEPNLLRERVPEQPEKHVDTGATTGIMPIVTEGEDCTASRDDDRGEAGHGG